MKSTVLRQVSSSAGTSLKTLGSEAKNARLPSLSLVVGTSVSPRPADRNDAPDRMPTTAVNSFLENAEAITLIALCTRSYSLDRMRKALDVSTSPRSCQSEITNVSSMNCSFAKSLPTAVDHPFYHNVTGRCIIPETITMLKPQNLEGVATYFLYWIIIACWKYKILQTCLDSSLPQQNARLSVCKETCNCYEAGLFGVHYVKLTIP